LRTEFSGAVPGLTQQSPIEERSPPMSKPIPPARIGIFGSTGVSGAERHGCGLWPAGYVSCVTAAGGEPVYLGETPSGKSWDHQLNGLHGILFAADDRTATRLAAAGERLCQWCRKRAFPILCIEHGLHILNTAFSGTVHQDLSREMPEALQH